MTSVIIWAVSLAGVALAGFAAGLAAGRQPFACDNARILATYLGCVLGLLFVAAVDAVTQMFWIHTAAQTVLLVCGIAVCLGCPVVVTRFIRDGRAKRRLRRSDLDACPACGYDLTGNVSGVCPECGTPIAEEQVRYIRGVSPLRQHALRHR